MATDSSRPTIELDAAVVGLLDHLRIASGLKTHRQVIDRALEVFHWVARERAYGSRIVSIDPAEGTVRELSLTVLDEFAEKGKRRRSAAWWRHAAQPTRRI
jgi:hypothetical protein